MTDDYLDNIHYLNLQRSIDLIVEYREELGEPAPNWPKSDFDDLSYSRWAVDEILSLVMTNTNKTPYSIIEEFKYNMNEGYTKYSRFPNIEKVFHIGYSVAEDLLERLYAMGF